jgi:hypothetical protein
MIELLSPDSSLDYYNIPLLKHNYEHFKSYFLMSLAFHVFELD